MPDPCWRNNQGESIQLCLRLLASHRPWIPLHPPSGFIPPPHANFLEKFWPVKPGRISLTGKCCAKVLCSVFAGVYNEFLIKGKGADIDIMIQNVFMYLDSIICNVLLLGVKGELSSAFTIEALSSLTNPFVLLLIVNNAVLGIITSLFLQVTLQNNPYNPLCRS